MRERHLSSLRLSVQPVATADLDTVGLWCLVEEARSSRTPTQAGSGSRSPKTSRALGDGSGSWRCCDCGVEKRRDGFSVSAKGYVRSYCKSCDNQRRANYARTLRGNAVCLVSSAKNRSKLKGWDCNLDVDFILDTVLQQQGKCAYSGVHMEMLLPHSDWRMSLERVDNAAGYVRENCVLIAAEFNSTEKLSRRVPMSATFGSSKWSLEKVQNFNSERLSNVDLHGLNRLISAAREGYRSLSRPVGFTAPKCDKLEEVEAIFGRFRCLRCGVWKPLECFHLCSQSARGHRSQCKQCKAAYDFACRTTLRGHIQSMLGHARARHKLGKWHGNFELDCASVLEMMVSQQGRCFYSDVPLRFAQLNVDWMVSLERLDNSKTYTQDNTVLVALEFNTPDHSRTAKSEVFGSGQWSRRKVEHVWGSLGEACHFV